MGSAVGGQFGEEAAEGFGDDGLAGAEFEVHAAVAVDHLVDGEGDDVGELLGVEQDQAAGHPVSEGEMIVVEESINDLPSGIGVHCRSLLGTPSGQDDGSEEFVSDGPVQEVGELMG